MNMSVGEFSRPTVTPVPVSEVAAWVGCASNNATEVRGAVIDSRRVCEGDVWFALPGAFTHAMEFAAQAVAAGAVAVVTDSAGAEIAQNTEALSSGIELLVVPNPRAVAGAAISRLYGSPSQAMTTVGVTGTNGKTSVTHFLLDAWRSTEEFHDCALLGTLGAAVPMHLELQGATGFTTPEADLLQWQLASFRDHGVRAVAMEVSSHSLHLHRVDGTHFDVVIFTNL